MPHLVVLWSNWSNLQLPSFVGETCNGKLIWLVDSKNEDFSSPINRKPARVVEYTKATIPYIKEELKSYCLGESMEGKDQRRGGLLKWYCSNPVNTNVKSRFLINN
ncbi:unnamed protein product [Lepeophtheirus salmonis]|uniref:(salmon louse) hypothetical protein n=1 Tax=Lepeophtheirus salmonis TaxID=72036 RepID=A0A7R8CHS6_LEPSM|nr:unnamed protein product [Lepeophtheirus salmonis]CAF2820967.1 unnamed protein product [Lepeophtheirus salmonis]